MALRFSLRRPAPSRAPHPAAAAAAGSSAVSSASRPQTRTRRAAVLRQHGLLGARRTRGPWRDKWEAHRRSSVDETRSPRTSPLAGAGTSAPWSIPARPQSGDVWAVSAGRGGAGRSFGSFASDDPMSVSSSGASTPSRLSLGSDPRVHGLGGAAGSSHPPVDVLRSKFFGGSYPPGPVGR